MEHDAGTRIIPVDNLTEYFRDALAGALTHQRIALDDHTAHYVVNLLTEFARAEQLHSGLPPGQRWPCLALLLGAACEARSPVEREAALQRLGDVSLFMAGFFAHGFATRLVDIDYHIAMGGRSYSLLAGTTTGTRRRAFAQVWTELSTKFGRLVDALGEISDSAKIWSHADILRLYEIWLKTGSGRARDLLSTLGVTPSTVSLRPN
jgi:hypothetical protein